MTAPSRTEAITSERFLTDADIAALVARYGAQQAVRLSHATVRDYCDSVDHVGRLASYSRDLKDQQRCWTIKAILSQVRPGSSIVEIGAGEPLVADVLARAGYHVTVFDPYDGSGGGPAVGAAFERFYPRLVFKRRLFDEKALDLQPASLDCIYSVSVLEHVPEAARAGVWAGLRRFLRPGGLSIHSVDHVLAGSGAEFHRGLIAAIGALHGIATDEVEGLLAQAMDDPDTYLLSAEAHDSWRAGRAYETFPMRRVTSVQICSELASR